MTNALSAVSLFGLRPVTNIEEVGAGSRARKAGGVNPYAGGESGGPGAINREITPTYGEQDSTFINGLGETKHTKMLWG